MATEKSKDKIAKPVYFNVTNQKEKELVDWIESKFTTFGGLVKDLLYKEMLIEQRKIQPIEVTQQPPVISSVEAETVVDNIEVEEYEC